jgi:hypothetical protein
MVQQRGLGLFAVRFLELVARKTHMEWVLTIVPFPGEPGLKLFRKAGFGVDQESPTVVYPDADTRPAGFHYEILSKCFLPQEVVQQHIAHINGGLLKNVNSKSAQSKMRLQNILMS